jgi:hypothetical protein
MTLPFGQIKAQINDNPVDVLATKLYENELLSNRFFRNFVFIKTNTFKNKAMSDMDRSLAKFDDNLSYIILHLPYDKEVKDDYLKLQNFWNVYRLNITNYNSENYKRLISKTQRLEKLITELNKKILSKHPDYSAHKSLISLASLAVENGKNVDKMATAYILKYGLNVADAYNYYEFDFSGLKKNLKKIRKNKLLQGKVNDLVTDLNTTVDSIKTLIEKDKYNPKMMYAYVNAYTKKTFKLLHVIMQLVK